MLDQKFMLVIYEQIPLILFWHEIKLLLYSVGD